MQQCRRTATGQSIFSDLLVHGRMHYKRAGDILHCRPGSFTRSDVYEALESDRCSPIFMPRMTAIYDDELELDGLNEGWLAFEHETQKGLVELDTVLRALIVDTAHE